MFKLIPKCLKCRSKSFWNEIDSDQNQHNWSISPDSIMSLLHYNFWYIIDVIFKKKHPMMLFKGCCEQLYWAIFENMKWLFWPGCWDVTYKGLTNKISRIALDYNTIICFDVCYSEALCYFGQKHNRLMFYKIHEDRSCFWVGFWRCFFLL